jgi:hypothetical protein
MKTTSRINTASEVGDWGIWFFINAPLLSGMGIAVFLLVVEFGTQAYIYIIPGFIVVALLVGLIHWYNLKKSPIANWWVIITIIAWLVTACSIPMFLGSSEDLLRSVGSLPGGGGVLGLCLCVPAIGPIVAVVAALVLANIKSSFLS